MRQRDFETFDAKALIDGRVVTYDACGKAANGKELRQLKNTYVKAFPVYLGVGIIYSVNGIRQSGVDQYHFFKRESE